MFKDKILLFNLIPFILSLGLTLSIPLLSKSLPPTLPLFYSLPWGENQLATLPQLLVVPASMVLVTLINLIIYWQLHDSQQLFKNIIIVSSLVSSLVLAITFVKIMLIFI